MILVIDTSSSRSVIATIDAKHSADTIFGSREPTPLATRFQEVVKDPRQVEKVAIATGPGSFTGLRRGAALGLGLAVGLRVPLVPLPTLELQAARGKGRLTALAEAGRGRFYFLVPGGQPLLARADEIPKDFKLVGLLSAESETLLREYGLHLASDREVQTVAEAASELLKSAREVPYESVKLEYMQSFGVRS